MKKNIIRSVFLIIVFFTAGFFSHALFFPYSFTDSPSFKAPKAVGAASGSSEQNQALTTVYYQDGQFSPRVVQIRKSYYIIIVNASEKELMWLTSENNLLVTPRGYAKMEGLKAQLYHPGVFTVSTTLHPSEKLQVIVK